MSDYRLLYPFDGQPEKIPLKEWAKSIHFVQLETNDSILIGNIRATILHKDKNTGTSQ